MTMRKPLKRCVNGCDAPPQLPSFVLCKPCLAALSKKIHELPDKLWPKRPKPEEDET